MVRVVRVRISPKIRGNIKRGPHEPKIFCCSDDVRNERLFYAAVFVAVAGDVAEGISEPEKQHAEGGNSKEYGEEVDAEGVETAATARVAKATFLADELGP